MKKSFLALAIILFILPSLFSCKKSGSLVNTKKIVKNKIENTVEIKLLTSTPIEVGDPIDIVLHINSPINSKIKYPKNDEQLKPFLLMSYHVKKKIKKNRKELYIYYTLTSTFPGKFTLKPLLVKIGNKSIQTSPLEIKVQSTIVKRESNDINDIMGPLKNNILWIFVIFPIVLVLIFIFFLRKKFAFLKLRKKARAETAEYEKENITYDPVLTSILSIYGLNNSSYKIKDKYYILSNSLKKFLGEIIGLNLMPLTTNKIKRLLRRYLSDESYNYLIKKLEKYDEIKFSKKALNKEYKKSLLISFSDETNDVLRFIYLILKNHYRKISEFLVGT